MDGQMLAIGLGLFSAITLAAANLSVKMGTDILIGRAILSTSAALLILPAAFFVPLPDAATWLALAAAIPAHFFYQICLVNALRADLSLVFPIMRGAAPLLTAVSALLFLREELTAAAWAGLVLATFAVIAFALPQKGTALKDHPDGRALLWAFATAVGVSLYNVADARGVRIAPIPFTYIVWLFLLDSILITVTALVVRKDALRQAVRMKWRYGVAAGALSIASFGAALYAFSLTEAAKVSALRETSVVFAAMMGSLYLGEGFGRRRLIAATILALGLVLMQFGR